MPDEFFVQTSGITVVAAIEVIALGPPGTGSADARLLQMENEIAELEAQLDSLTGGADAVAVLRLTVNGTPDAQVTLSDFQTGDVLRVVAVTGSTDITDLTPGRIIRVQPGVRPGYTTPPGDTVTLIAGRVTRSILSYVPETLSAVSLKINVTGTPVAPVQITPLGSVNAPAFDGSVTGSRTVTGLTPGIEYRVVAGGVPGYSAPEIRYITLSQDGEVTLPYIAQTFALTLELFGLNPAPFTVFNKTRNEMLTHPDSNGVEMLSTGYQVTRAMYGDEIVYTPQPVAGWVDEGPKSILFNGNKTVSFLYAEATTAPSVPEPAPLRQSYDAQQAGTYASQTRSLPTAAKAGNLLLAALAIDKGPGAWSTPPAGWTVLADYIGASVGTRLLYRYAVGGEINLSLSWETARTSSVMFFGEFEGVGAGVAPRIVTSNSGESPVSSLDLPPIPVATPVQVNATPRTSERYDATYIYLLGSGEAARITVPAGVAGAHKLQLRAKGDVYQGNPIVEVRRGGAVLGQISVGATETLYDLGNVNGTSPNITVNAGDALDLVFVNDFSAAGGYPNDRNVAIDYAVLTPVGTSQPATLAVPDKGLLLGIFAADSHNGLSAPVWEGGLVTLANTASAIEGSAPEVPELNIVWRSLPAAANLSTRVAFNGSFSDQAWAALIWFPAASSTPSAAMWRLTLSLGVGGPASAPVTLTNNKTGAVLRSGPLSTAETLNVVNGTNVLIAPGAVSGYTPPASRLVVVSADENIQLSYVANTPTVNVTTVDHNATTETKQVYAWNQQIVDENKLISGQSIDHDGTHPIEGYAYYIDKCKTDMGRTPLEVGCGMSHTDLTSAINMLVAHWNKGGLVTIDAHISNPWGGSAWVSNPETTAKPNLMLLLTTAPASPEKTKWLTSLGRIKDALLEMQGRGVHGVRIRLLHESSTPHFWWGCDVMNRQRARDGFKALWREMVQFFINSGVHIGLFDYNNMPGWWDKPADRFPGPEWVDYVTLDRYDTELEPVKADDPANIMYYWNTYRKPTGYAEVGPQGASTGGSWDVRNVLVSKNTWYPKFGRGFLWHSFSGLKYAFVDLNKTQVVEFLTHSQVLTLESSARAWRTVTPQTVPTTQTTYRIMPLGDSTTEGVPGTTGGWRPAARQQLTTAGVGVDYVGSVAGVSFADDQHEGHSGWRTDELLTQIDSWLSTANPDIVLLMAGTDDVYENNDNEFANAPARLGQIVDKIHTWKSNTLVIVSTITPLAGTSSDWWVSRVSNYNAAIPGIVSARANAGKRVRFADIGASITTADLVDGTHPSDAGYGKMATAWAAAVKTALLTN